MGTKAEDSTRDVLQISCEIFGSHGRGRNLKKLVVSEKFCHSLADLVHKKNSENPMVKRFVESVQEIVTGK